MKLMRSDLKCVAFVPFSGDVTENEQMIKFCFIYVLYTSQVFKHQVMKINELNSQFNVTGCVALWIM